MKIKGKEVFGIIYLIKNIVNNKYYVGQTKQNFYKRYPFRRKKPIEAIYAYHLSNKLHGRRYNYNLLEDIKKYGYASFEVNTCFDIASSREELNQKEIYWINKFDSVKNGYNSTRGGSGDKDDRYKEEVICLNNKKIYSNAEEIEKESGFIKVSDVIKCCELVCDTIKGYKFMYLIQYKRAIMAHEIEIKENEVKKIIEKENIQNNSIKKKILLEHGKTGLDFLKGFEQIGKHYTNNKEIG